MKTRVLFLFLTAMAISGLSKAQQSYVQTGTNDTIKVATTNLNGEILPWIVLNEVRIVATRTFKSKEDFDNYRRLRYNVLKVLPYARFAGQRYRQLERDLAVTSNKRKQKALV